MKTGMSLVIWLCLFAPSFGAGYPTFSAVVKHPIGGGRFMLVVPGYSGYPIFVDAQDQVVAPPETEVAPPTTVARLPDGSLVFQPFPQPVPVIVNPQPAFVVFPTPLRTGWDGPPTLGR